MSAYYNEWDKKAAAWLRALIAQGHLPQGDVDERSITDVRAEDLAGYTQHHFFAGIGGWALAARLARWPDDRPLVTGSCPCQPFSVAGKGEGVADERHLWPDLFRILRALRPACFMGEQVAAAVGKHWLDGVRADMEGIGYAVRAVVIPACAVDAPHRRDRLWFAAGRGAVVDAEGVGWGEGRPEPELRSGRPAVASAGVPCGDVANAESERRNGRQDTTQSDGRAGAQTASGALADADKRGRLAWSDREAARYGDTVAASHWAGAKWLISHDGKARRVEPDVRLLVDGIPGRVGLLRGFGNAIVAPLAAEMLGAWLEEFPEISE